MIVVADTSALNYLVLIDQVDLLPALFGEVLIPQAVFQELKHPKTPAKVQQWISHFPAWLEVRTVESVSSPALMKLDVANAKPFNWRWSLESALCFSMKRMGGKRRKTSIWKFAERWRFWSAGPNWARSISAKP